MKKTLFVKNKGVILKQIENVVLLHTFSNTNNLKNKHPEVSLQLKGISLSENFLSGEATTCQGLKGRSYFKNTLENKF